MVLTYPIRQRIRFVTLDRVSATGTGNGTIGLSFSKTELRDPFVVDNIEPDVRRGGGDML